MKILLAASEAVPFCKTGGLADVAGTLASKLAELGHETHLFLPLYKSVEAPGLSGPAQSFSVDWDGEKIPVSLRELRRKSLTVHFIDQPALYGREGLYGQGGTDYPDNDRRFGVFCRAVLEGARAAGLKPEVVHVHDWQTGLIPAYLKRRYRGEPAFAQAACLFSVHNMAYQGCFAPQAARAAGFGWEDFTPDGFEYYGRFSFLKAGLVFADLLATVSATYAREIQESAERGFGFEGLLKRRSSELFGVLNGIDLEVWNPASDGALRRPFSAADYAWGKAECKADLQSRCGLDKRTDLPLVGIVSRLDHQKGLDLAIDALRPRLGRCQAAVLGTGEPKLAAAFKALAAENPKSAYLHSSFDEDFAHRLYAGADIFLMPSRFEPCGLGQMIAMRYGCAPVVSRTGGLADTVTEENGFLCRPGDPGSLAEALDRALAAYGGPDWSGRCRAALACDFSWDRSIARYLELYDRARARLSPR